MRTYLLIIAALLSAQVALAQGLGGEPPVRFRGLLSVDKIQPGGAVEVAVVAEIAKDWHIFSQTPGMEGIVPTKVAFEPLPGFTFGPVEFPPARRAPIEALGQELEFYEGRAVFKASVRVARDAPLGPRTLRATVSFQACSNTVCMRPMEETVEIPAAVVGLGEAVSRMNEETFGSGGPPPFSPSPPLPVGGTGGQGDRGEDEVAGYFREKGLLLTLILIFVGGLALNLTPCVYPMIPITVGFFASQSAGLRRTFGLALAYVAGMAATYSALGTAAALTGGLFGSVLQSRWALIVLAGVFIALALSMFGAYELRLPAGLAMRLGTKGGRGFIGAFVMGTVAGTLAVSCIGPLILALIVYVGRTGNPLLGFWLFFVLASGLGLPYLALAVFSGRMGALPRAGAWMVSIKKLFGAALLGMALYYLRGFLPPSVALALFGVLLITVAVFAGALERLPEGSAWAGPLRKSFGVIVLLAGIYCFIGALWRAGFLLPAPPPGASASAPGAAVVGRDGDGIAWVYDEAEGLQRAEAERKPAMIDFYSDVWCPACIELDRFTYSDPQVIAESRRFVSVKIHVDRNPHAKALMARYGIRGVPTILFKDSSGREVDGLRIVGFKAADEFLSVMRQVR